MQILTVAWRFPWCVASATTYQLLSNPYAIGLLLVITGHWRLGVAVVLLWLALCAVAVATGVHRKSRLAGLEEADIFTAHRYLGLLGDEQQGWTPQFLVDKWKPGTPLWVIAFSCAAWRNKLRNLPFVPSLAWLHKPAGKLVWKEWRAGKVLFILKWRGWMTEFQYVTAKRFGDFGPRLDQPDAWGAISWAFRPAGRL